MRSHLSLAAVGTTALMALTLQSSTSPVQAAAPTQSGPRSEGVDGCPQVGRIASARVISPGHSRAVQVPDHAAAARTWKSLHSDEALEVVTDLGHGGRVTEIAPRPGWKAKEAPTLQVRAFRATLDPAGRDGNLTSSAPTSFCRGKGVAGATLPDRLSPNWSGGVVHNNTGSTINQTPRVDSYYEAEMKWVQPHYTFAPCHTPSLNAIWTGLGGWNSGRLVQAGSEVSSQTDPNAAKFFWEVLTDVPGGYSFNELLMDRPVLRAGDLARTTVTFDKTNGNLEFQFRNDTTGEYKEFYFKKDWIGDANGNVGNPTPDYYDGSTAAFISESTCQDTGCGSYFPLRKPTAPISFPYATVNGRQPIAKFPSVRAVNYAYNGGWKQSHTYDGAHAWTNTWLSCQ